MALRSRALSPLQKRQGEKQVFLPSAVITLCRPKHPMPPQFAMFKVPRQFSKLDMRDYLRNAYNVVAVGVRSAVVQQPVRMNEVTGRYSRRQPLKYMTVEMTSPWAWPDEPTHDEVRKHWDNEAMDKGAEMEAENERRKEAFEQRSTFLTPRMLKETEDRKALRSQAQSLLDGSVKWDNKRELDPRWRKDGKDES